MRDERFADDDNDDAEFYDGEEHDSGPRYPSVFEGPVGAFGDVRDGVTPEMHREGMASCSQRLIDHVGYTPPERLLTAEEFRAKYMQK